MKPEEIRQLLGGYASGTLTEAEKSLLFEAALEDQVLFDAMADEQALKDLLDDPESRGYLQAVLDEPPVKREVLRDPASFQSMTASAPAAPPRARAVEPVPQPVPMQTDAKRRRPPQMWWGLLAAAGLAAVSVVGILKLNQPPQAVQIAKNDRPAPAGSVAGKPAPVPANPVSHSEPKPAVSSAKVPKGTNKNALGAAVPREELDSKQANEAPKKAAALEPPDAKPAQTAPEQQAFKKEAEARVPTPAPAPPPPPAQAQQPVTTESNQARVVEAPGGAESQTATATQQAAPGAREMYFSGETQVRGRAVLKDQQATDQLGQAQSSRDQAAAAGRVDTKRKAAPAAAGALGGAVAPRAPAPALAKAAPATVAPRAAFAMRYRVLRRRSGTDFPAPPGTAFRVGEEIVVEIDKNSGGTAEIVRAGVGPVPMSVQTNVMARSVPVTVTGPMELTVTLTRTGAASNGPRRETLAQPAPSQQLEVADGMVYVAEPSVASGQPLVVRIAIHVNQ